MYYFNRAFCSHNTGLLVVPPDLKGGSASAIAPISPGLGSSSPFFLIHLIVSIGLDDPEVSLSSGVANSRP